jgi:hypothetical protein
MNTTNTTEIDALALRAHRLLRTDAYLPGRAHFASIVAERIYHEVVGLLAKPRHNANGRATLAALAASLYRVAGDDARAEGARMLGASIMGTRFDGGSL